MSEERKVVKLDEQRYVEVVSERYNPLIKRLELTCVISHFGSGTPSRKELREVLSKVYGKPPENIYVRSIVSEYGVGKSLAKVNIYDSRERATAFEPEYIIKRHAS